MKSSIVPNSLKVLFVFFFTLSFNGLSAQDSWRLVYHNNEDGEAVEGQISDLITAVKEGKEIRMAWWGRRVYHLSDASFLTILTDSVVFGQIKPIYGQTPEFTDYTITLKENLQWSMTGGTNGKSDAMMTNTATGEIAGHNARKRAFKWYVRE